MNTRETMLALRALLESVSVLCACNRWLNARARRKIVTRRHE